MLPIRPVVVAIVVSMAGSSASATKIAVLPTRVETSAQDQVPELFDDLFLSALQKAGDFDVVGQDDINQLLSFDRMKELAGCEDVSCFAEIGGALGVEGLVALKVSRLDGEWVVAGKRFDLEEVRVAARTTELIRGDAKALIRAIPGIAEKLAPADGTGDVTRPAATPPPIVGASPPRDEPPYVRPATVQPVRPKSRTTGWVLVAAGAVLLLGSLAFDVGAPSSHDGDLGFVDLLPVAGYSGGATLLISGIYSL